MAQLYTNKQRVYMKAGPHKGKTFEPGQLTDALEHLSEEERELLVLRGVYAKATTKTPKAASGGES